MKKEARPVKYLKLTVPIDHLLIYGLIQPLMCDNYSYSYTSLWGVPNEEFQLHILYHTT